MPSHPTLRLTSCMVFTNLFLCICKQQSNHRNECLIPTCSTPAVGICGICCETGDCFMFTVPFRSAAIITADILPGLQWFRINGAPTMPGMTHMTVNLFTLRIQTVVRTCRTLKNNENWLKNGTSARTVRIDINLIPTCANSCGKTVWKSDKRNSLRQCYRT